MCSARHRDTNSTIHADVPVKNLSSALVTGATGFIGTALVRRLLAEKFEVACLVRGSSRNLSALAGLSGVKVIAVPSFHTEQLKPALAGTSVEVVFNLASYGVHQEHRDPQQLIDGNLGILTHVLEATSRWPMRKFIHASSCSEYGSPRPSKSGVSEAEPLRPVSLYGAAKTASFVYGNALASTFGIPFVALRLFGVFGPGETRQRLVPYLIQRLQREESAELTPGEQVRDFLYIDDVIDAFLAAAQEEGLEPGRAYNVCSGQPVRVREIGEAVADAIQKPRRLLHWGKRAYREDEPEWLVGDNSQFKRATSWRPQLSLNRGIHRMIEALSLEAPASQENIR